MKQYQVHFHLTGGVSKRIITGGKQYAVYPVVMLLPGVHQGAIGPPVYYPAETIAKSAHLWAGVAATIFHPVNAQGDYCLLASSPANRQEWAIGDIDSPFSKIGKLIGKIRLDVVKTNQKYPGLIEALDAGEPMDVSTGLLATDDGRPGQWGGKKYAATITEIIPDHLALLPGSQGACSWNDGCGIRANTIFTGGSTMTQEAPYVAPKLFENQQRSDNDNRLELAINHLKKEYGEQAGNFKIKEMSGASLLLLGEQLQREQKNNSYQDQQTGEGDVLVPVQMFQGQGRN